MGTQGTTGQEVKGMKRGRYQTCDFSIKDSPFLYSINAESSFSLAKSRILAPRRTSRSQVHNIPLINFTSGPNSIHKLYAFHTITSSTILSGPQISKNLEPPPQRESTCSGRTHMCIVKAEVLKFLLRPSVSLGGSLGARSNAVAKCK